MNKCLSNLIFKSIEELLPYPNNARLHSEEQIGQIAASIEAFGFNNPILIDGNNGIIAGHGRLMAAKKIGLETVPTLEIRHLTEAQKRAYILADNRIAENATWDMERIAQELTSIIDEIDIELTGFDDSFFKVDDIEEGLTDPDDIPTEKKEIISRPGDIWIMGDHRLMCGDSTLIDDVKRLMAGEKAGICLTDPPYGIIETGREKGNYDICEDTQQNLIDLASKWLPIAINLSNVVVFSSGIKNISIYPAPDWVLCWFYGAGPLLSRWGFNCWQPFLCYGKDPSLATGKGSRPDAVNINIPANAQNIDHPCPKPISIWLWMIERLSFSDGDLFYEPFSGSGTTIIAAQKTNRRCYAMEISGRYVDVAVRRWQEFTGKDAILESSGEIFNDREPVEVNENAING